MKGFVLSYFNPDTDSVCCSLAYCLYKNKKGHEFYTVIAGEVSDETKFVLRKFNCSNLMVKAYDDNEKIVLIDTHNHMQIPHLTKYDNVIEIIDHHIDGDDSIFKNALLINEKVGAAATILYFMIKKDNLLDDTIALLLGASIISNTLNFCAPSTTDYDKKAFLELNNYYSFDDKFINDLFATKNSLFHLKPKEIIEQDLKAFKINDKKLLISQIETLDSTNLLNNNNFKDEILLKITSHECDAFIFNIIDIISKKSIVLVFDNYSIKLLSLIFPNVKISNVNKFDRILLRKTDFIPKIKELFPEV